MRKVLVALVMILTLTGLAWAQAAEQPSLADLARQVRAERAKKKATKVPMFTNETVAQTSGTISTIGEAAAPAAEGAAPSAEGTPAAEGAAGAAAGTGAAAGEAAGGEKECTETCWRGKFHEQRAKIATAQKELDILQREFSLARTQYSSDPNAAMRDQYSNNPAGGRELQDKQNQINAKTTDIQQLQRGLADLEDQLRRAGGKPDWARE